METVDKKSKKKPSKIEDMTKEQIRQAILKKKECNSKALQIVESLLEKDITETYLLECLPDINRAHFDDIIEERSITHLCGYPVCDNSISQKDVPKQQYRISLKTNKVYDITARKNFCSNICFQSAMYVKNQMLTSPLWFREYENIPKFKLLPLDTVGSMGQEIDVAIIDRVKIKSDERSFTSINEFTTASLKEIQKDDHVHENHHHEDEPEYDNKLPQSEITKVHTENINKLDVSLENKSVIEQPREQKQSVSNKETKTTTPNLFNIVGEIIEKPERKIDPIITAAPMPSKDNKPKKTPQKKPPLVMALTIQVEKCLAEWFTLDTMLFLFGDVKVREMVAHKGECIKKYLNNYAKGIFYNANSYDQYQQLCKKLNMLELEDRKYDAQNVQRDMKPLPDYSIIQEESKKMQLKLKAFFAGETDISTPESTVKDVVENSEKDNVTLLPLVDKNAQNALRRRIVCEYLNKVLPDLLRSLGLLTLSVSSDIRLLVNTFKLNANNIMFKPIQWTLIAIVFIKLLSIRDRRLMYLLEQPMAFQHMQLLLLSYKQDGGYLSRLISWLTDIDRLLDTNDTQLTIENS